MYLDTEMVHTSKIFPLVKFKRTSQKDTPEIWRFRLSNDTLLTYFVGNAEITTSTVSLLRRDLH